MQRPQLRLTTGPSSGLVGIVFALGAGTPTSAAHVSHPVSGVVTDADSGYPVEDVTVTAEGSPNEVRTDASGRFTLKAVPPGPFTLHLRSPAYRPRSLVISAEARTEPVLIAVQLSEENILTVLGTRVHPRTASTTLLAGAGLTSAPRRNAEEVLRQVPGLTLVQHGSEGKGHQFFLRGFDAAHGADLEITLDGIPLNEWSNVHAQGYLDLGLIIPEVIEGVEVTKGPHGLSQGAFAMAGSADYRLGVPLGGGRAAYTAGTTQRHRLLAMYAPESGDGREFAAAEATHDTGFGKNRRLNRATFNGQTGLLDLEDGGRLTLFGGGLYSAFELPGTRRNDDLELGFYDTYDAQSAGRSARALLALRLEAGALRVLAYGGYRRLDLMENFTGFLLDPVHGDRRDQEHTAWSFGASATHEQPVLETLVVTMGLGMRGDVFRQREDRVGRDLEVVSERRDLRGLQLIGHGFFGLAWRQGRVLDIDAGTRADVIHVQTNDALDGDARGSGTRTVFSPRVTARLRPVERLSLFAAYGRGFRPPEARAFITFDPGRSGISQDVFTGGRPEATVSDALEAGMRWNPVRWIRARLSGFATFIERESVLDHVSGVSLELNGTRRLGGELVVESRPVRWLMLSADATMTDARFVESGRRIPLAPWLVSGVRAAVAHAGFRAGARLIVVAPRPLPHGATGATLTMLDATFGYHWDAFLLDVEIENLLNRQVREGEYHYASHWQPSQPASELPVLHTTAGAPLNARVTLSVLF